MNIAFHDDILTTGVPWKGWQSSQTDNEIKDGPANDDTIVDIEKTDKNHGGGTCSSQKRT